MSKSVSVIFGLAGLIVLSALMIRAGVITVSAPDFQAEDGSDDFIVAQGGWGDYLYRAADAVETYAVSPINIPTSVLIKYVRFHYMENDASNDAFMAVVRSNKYTGAHNVIYSYWTSGASSSITYATDYSASPSASYALTNIDACNYTGDVYFNGTGGSSAFKFYGMTLVYDPYP